MKKSKQKEKGLNKENNNNEDMAKLSEKDKKNLTILIIAGVFLFLSAGGSTFVLLQDLFSKLWASPLLILFIIIVFIYLKAAKKQW